MACASCGKKGDPAVAKARQALEQRYSTNSRVKNGACPLDGSRASVRWVRAGRVKLGYRECERGHVLRL